jgi:hypothetical protein
MTSLLLIGHVFMAVISLAYAVGVIGASRNQKLELAGNRTKKMWYGTLITVFSGILLTVLVKSSIGRLCGTLLVFLMVVLAAHFYQRAVHKRSYLA